MPTFYEILEVAPSADAQTIESSIEAHYNQIRRLTTHYDAAVVNQANQALLVLEQARAILLNPSKRADYDSSLGFAVGGLAIEGTTPPAQFTSTGGVQVPLSNFQQPVQAQAALVANVWVCRKCQRPNPAGTSFCQNCGETVGRICPNCQATYEAKANFCPRCGQNYDAAAQKSQLSAELSKKKIERYSQPAASSNLNDALFMEYVITVGTGWAIYMAVTTILFLFLTIFRLIFSVIPYQNLNEEWVRTVVSIFSGFVTFLRWVIFAGVAGGLFMMHRRNAFALNKIAFAGYVFLSFLGIVFGGWSFYEQVYRNQGNTWLIFQSLIAGAAIAGGWFFTRSYAGANQYPPFSISFLKPVQPLMLQAIHYFDRYFMIACGAGAGLAFLTLIFSAMSSVLSFFGGLFSLGAAMCLGILAYRTSVVVETARMNMKNEQQALQARLTHMDAEIANLEDQIQKM